MMSITIATDGMLWPLANIVREQFEKIEVLCDDPHRIEVMVDPSDVEIQVEVCSDEGIAVEIAPESNEAIVEVDAECPVVDIKVECDD